MEVNIKKIVELLKQAKQPQSDFVKLMDSFESPYLVLISCILSLRTNDKTTYPATLRMLNLGKTPKDFAKVKVEDLEKAIYPVGFYKNKAKQIIELSKILVEKYIGSPGPARHSPRSRRQGRTSHELLRRGEDL